MLQRAATNACSWWWASHVRTKQSKWLEYSLQEMEEKVVETLKILDDEGDSFAKRAEMYYRKRPEIISFVEESFRAYKSLAEKYDHLSREFQSANRTIASCFPERAQYPLDEDEDEDEDEEKGRGITSSVNDNESPATPTSSIPKVPKMSKDAAISEIDKLQKEILTQQTEKEFVRSLYERSYEKHWEIEDQIEAMRKESCQETLAKLQEIQAKSSEEAKVEYERVRQAHEKFEALRDEFIYRHISHMDPEPHDGDKSETEGEEQMKKEEKASLEQEAQDVNQLREKIKEQLAGDSSRSLSVAEMVERIDELVDTVVSPESCSFLSIKLGRGEIETRDDLETNIKTDQMNKKLKELEEELRKVKNLNQNVKNRDNSLQTHFTEASCNLEHLSERLLDVKIKKLGRLENDDLSETVSNQDIELQDFHGGDEDRPNWRQMFISGLDDREKILLEEYTSTLRNYKDVRRTSFTDLIESRRDILKSSENIKCSFKIDDAERFRAYQVSKRYPLSNLEKKFRFDIDDLLEENLEFWLRFSTSLHQIQKFQNSIQDLQAELKKAKDYNNRNSNSKQPSSQSEIWPIFRHMREIRAELSLWLENNSILQEELHGRYSSLCNIQDKISRVAIVDSELSGYQAAKFQGEVLHLKQENNKIASELQAGLSLVKRLKVEVDKTLEDLDQTFEVGTQPRIKHSSSSRNRIPLRSFLFEAKLKKPRQSLFACVNPHFSNLEATKENAPI
ncbi:hypothetical protein K1719_021495 [Acacia pycnantha]|nr:hypothetical protein K1719_021495 [Acacia pycnantha]